VGLAGPGWGLAVDAISFAMAAGLRAGMRFPAMPAVAKESTLHQLRVGWREFLARRWLWSIVAEFTLMTAVTSGTINVLGPVVADARLGGARSWGLILAGYGVGAVVGSLVMMRYRPRRMLLVASLAAGLFAALLFALAVPLAVPLIVAASFVVGFGADVFMVNWVTTMQQEIPHDLMSRLSSFDAMGSFALAPVGVAVAGPLASAFGTTSVLVVGGLVIVGLTLAVILLVPEVRQLRRRSSVSSVESERPEEAASARP
ncbi:MAG: MFS transporter, partial [Nocardiopsaceae bacterium]|jgi:predicted MFS family arabinose efflux permease|nr:MFS transporter [Nocardiopsaceae bacterium]